MINAEEECSDLQFRQLNSQGACGCASTINQDRPTRCRRSVTGQRQLKGLIERLCSSTDAHPQSRGLGKRKRIGDMDREISIGKHEFTECTNAVICAMT